MHINYIDTVCYITCMLYIFHRKCITWLDQQNKFHIFLTYILFTMHFSRNQHFNHLNKAIYKSSQNWHATFLTCRSSNKDHNKICFNKFGAKLTKIWIFESFKHFLKNIFKAPIKNRPLKNAGCTPLLHPTSALERLTVGSPGPPVTHTGRARRRSHRRWAPRRWGSPQTDSPRRGEAGGA
jgi:hypothetical protein